MLKRIFIKNVKSFRNGTTLELVSSKGEKFLDVNTFSVGKHNLIKSALVYGANSSGKSNLINSIKLFMEIVLGNHDVQSELIRSVEPFLFNKESKLNVSEFSINFIINKIEYEYSFDVSNGAVISESLYKTIDRKTLLFKRTSSSYKDIDIAKSFNFHGGLLNGLRGDVLFLTFSSFLNNELSNSIKEFFETIYFEIQNIKKPLYLIDETDKVMTEKYLTFLKYSDSNIKEVTLDDEKNLVVIYDVFSRDYESSNDIKLLFSEYISGGTSRYCRLLKHLLYVLENGGVFVIDELDKQLHPYLTRKILEMFNSIEHNKKNAQLIATVHDATLMESNLRKEQIYFTNRNIYGESELYSLSNFKGARKDDNKLKKYLQGKYISMPKF